MWCFKHHIYDKTVLWGTVFIIQTTDRMQYFTILQYKLHSFNIQDDRSTRGLLTKPLKKLLKSPIRSAGSRTWLSSSVLMFLGELLGLLTNLYWSSQRTSSNWLAWGLSQCAHLTSGTRFHLRLKAAHLSLSLKLSLRPIFFDKHIFRTFRLSIFSILRIFFTFFSV